MQGCCCSHLARPSAQQSAILVIALGSQLVFARRYSLSLVVSSGLLGARATGISSLVISGETVCHTLSRWVLGKTLIFEVNSAEVLLVWP